MRRPRSLASALLAHGLLAALALARQSRAEDLAGLYRVSGRLAGAPAEGTLDLGSGEHPAARLDGLRGGAAIALVGSGDVVRALAAGRPARVRAGAVPLRATPSLTALVVGRLAPDSIVTVVGLTLPFAEVRQGGHRHYVWADRLAPVAASGLTLSFGAPTSPVRLSLAASPDRLEEPDGLVLERLVPRDLAGTVERAGPDLVLATESARFLLEGPEAAALEARLGGPEAVRGWPVRLGVLAAGGVARVVTASTTEALATAPIAPGVLRRQLERPLFGSPQGLFLVEVDPRAAGVRLRVAAPFAAGAATSAIGSTTRARVALNGGYFDGARRPVGLVRIDGKTLAGPIAGKPARAALGIDALGLVSVERFAAGADWTSVRDALGAGPSLLTAGKPDPTWVAEGFVKSFATGRHPRSAVGVRLDGHVVLLAADGRSPLAAGLTLAELARVLAVLGCERAINLDGGGSTALWVRGAGVLNRPSDGSERKVANALVVEAP